MLLLLMSILKKIFFLAFYFRSYHFKPTYLTFGTVLMVNFSLVFLMWNTFIVIASLTKVQSYFKIIKISSLATINFFLFLFVFLFSHGYLVVYYTDFFAKSGKSILVCPESLYLLKYYESKFSSYISYNVYKNILNIFEILYKKCPANFLLFYFKINFWRSAFKMKTFLVSIIYSC